MFPILRIVYICYCLGRNNADRGELRYMRTTKTLNCLKMYAGVYNTSWNVRPVNSEVLGAQCGRATLLRVIETIDRLKGHPPRQCDYKLHFLLCRERHHAHHLSRRCNFSRSDVTRDLTAFPNRSLHVVTLSRVSSAEQSLR